MSTTTPTNLSSAPPALIYAFIKHGNELSSLLPESKESLTEEKETQIAEAINRIWEGRAHAQLPETFPDKIIPKVFKKIQSSLIKAVDLTTNEKAQSMLLEVEEALRKHQQDEEEKKKRKLESPKTSSPSTDGGAGDDLTPFPWNVKHPEVDYKEAFDKLSSTQQKCLSFCCGLLPHDGKVSWVEISKRELMHWWTGMNFIENPCDGEDVLAKLVDEEFLIKRSSCPAVNHNSNMHSRLSRRSSTNSYIMHTNTLSNIQRNSLFLRRKDEEDSNERPLYMVSEKEGKEVVVAINRHKFTINADFFQWYFETSNVRDVEILHLGSWPYNPKRYVVVEDIETLKSFLSRTCRKVASLSLRGIIGIISLPDSICDIKTLKVLDLKSCPSLETMPKGINSLENLTHLDVSECYLLEYIPKGIESLSQLQVLKGFIINPPKHSENQCSFNVLSNLKKLIKLDIHARVMEFPTYQDLETLSGMEQLKKLKVTWVLKTDHDSSKDDQVKKGLNNDLLEDRPLPVNLEKLELNAAPEMNASRLLDSINYRSSSCPQKLYIIGGGLWKLDPCKYCFLNVQTLRLRHLPQLHMKWVDCHRIFPKLSHLEVYKCPKLIFFLCDDNGIWDKTEQS